MADRQVTVKVAIKPAEADPLRKVFQKIRDESVTTERGISRDLSKLRESYKPLFPGRALGAGGSGLGATLAKAFGGGNNPYGGLSAPNVVGGKLGNIAAPTSGIAGLVGQHFGGATGAGVGKLLGAVGPALGAAGAILAAGTAIAESLKSAALSTAALASPGTVKLLNVTLEDLGGVIGRVAVPFVEVVTEEFRLLGDVLATILPSTEDLRAALGPIREVVGGLRDILAEVAPLLRTVVTTGLHAFAEALRAVTYPLRFAVSLLRELGLIGGQQLNSSIGAAARPVSTHTDAVAFARETYQEIASNLAAQGGGPAPETAVDEAAAAAKVCAAYLRNIVDWTKERKADVQALPSQAAGAAWNLTGGIVRAMVGF